MYSWRSTPNKTGLDILVDKADETLPLLCACFVSMKPMLWWIDAVTGATQVHQTEARLLNFHTMVMGGDYLDATTGTVGEAAVAASVFAPLFASYDYKAEAVLDGAFAYNMPPRTALWAGGASFFVTANPIPEQPRAQGALNGAVRQWLVEHLGVARRARDFTYGVMHLFHRVTEDASADSDLHFEADLACWGPSDFADMAVIADRALAQARRELSGTRDPWWAYHNWMYTAGTVTGRALGSPSTPPPIGPLPPTTCPS
jgi:hypothetical protein